MAAISTPFPVILVLARRHLGDRARTGVHKHLVLGGALKHGHHVDDGAAFGFKRRLHGSAAGMPLRDGCGLD